MAEPLGVSEQEARNMVARHALRVAQAEDTPAQAEAIAIARVEALVLPFMSAAQAGDAKAAQTVLALERRRADLRERRARRLGLDAWKEELDLPPPGEDG